MGVVGDGVGEGGWCWAEVRVNCLPVSKKKAACRSGRQLPIRQTPEHHPGSQSRQQGRAGQEHHGLVMTMTELSRCCFRIFMVIY